MGSTFLNSPRIGSHIELNELKDKMCFLGIPWDSGSIYGTGAAQAPDAIRNASQKFDGYHIDLEMSMADLPLVDFGNILCTDLKDISTNKSISCLRDRVHETIYDITIPDLCLVVGGDHLITAASFLPKNPEESALIWVDSHLDLMNSYPGTNQWTNSTVLRRIIEFSNIPPNNIWIIGTHGYNHSPEELDYIKKNDINYYSLYNLRRNLGDVLKTVQTSISEKKFVYLSVDIDVLDPAYAPGTLAREPAGLTPHELFKIIHVCSPYLNAIDLVEVYPNHDPFGTTVEIAAAILIEACTYRFRANI